MQTVPDHPNAQAASGALQAVITVRPTTIAEPLCISANATSDRPDPIPADNVQNDKCLGVEITADVSAFLAARSAVSVRGESITYDLTVTNNGCVYCPVSLVIPFAGVCGVSRSSAHGVARACRPSNAEFVYASVSLPPEVTMPSTTHPNCSVTGQVRSVARACPVLLLTVRVRLACCDSSSSVTLA